MVKGVNLPKIDKLVPLTTDFMKLKIFEECMSETLLYKGDCLIEMNKIADKSVDMILCDLPYGTTTCSWDVIIPFDKLWEQYNRIIKDNGAIVLFGIEPFSSMLRMSNIKNYRYDLYWKKEKPTNFLQLKKKIR